jgi:hypothetical protein
MYIGRADARKLRNLVQILRRRRMYVAQEQ